MNKIDIKSQLKAAEQRGYEMGLTKSALILLDKCMVDGIAFKDGVEIVSELFGMCGDELTVNFERLLMKTTGNH